MTATKSWNIAGLTLATIDQVRQGLNAVRMYSLTLTVPDHETIEHFNPAQLLDCLNELLIAWRPGDPVLRIGETDVREMFQETVQRCTT